VKPHHPNTRSRHAPQNPQRGRQPTRGEAGGARLENELHRLDAAVPFRERLRQLQDRVLSRPTTGLEADKAFYDELSGNP
jgi:antitoxin VapB